MQLYNRHFSPTHGKDIVLAIIGALCGAAVGIKFADIDLYAPEWLLHHRAFITHGVIIPLCLFWGSWHTRHHALRGAMIGFCVTNAVHLSFDLFPRSWWGYALIHIFIWALPPVISWLWIAFSITICLYLVRMAMRTIWERIILCGGICAGFFTYAHEGGILPILAFLLAGVIAYLLPYTSHKDQ